MSGQWQGGAIPNNSAIIIQTTSYACVSYDNPNSPYYSTPTSLTNYVYLGSWVDGDAGANYLLATNGSISAAQFTVTTWQNEPNQYMPGGDPSQFQGIILQAADGTYLAVDECGYYITGASQDQARIWYLDLSMGNTTQIYDIGLVYSQRSSLGDPTAQVPDYTAMFTNPVPATTNWDPNSPILLQWQQGISPQAIVSIFYP